MSECRFAHDDGAYVLGALSPEDRLAFERHLASCPECAQSVRELAGLPGLLARIPVDTLGPEQPAAPPVPDTLLPGLVRRARRTRRRRAWLTGGLVAAAAVVAVGSGVVIGQQVAGDGEPAAAAPATAEPQVMEAVGDAPIKATVALTSVGWGTRLDFTCEYDDKGGPPGDDQEPAYREESQSSYAMYVRTSSGSVEQVASWRALPHKVLRIAAATAADRDDITEVQVRASDGRTVLRYPA